MHMQCTCIKCWAFIGLGLGYLVLSNRSESYVDVHTRQMHVRKYRVVDSSVSNRAALALSPYTVSSSDTILPTLVLDGLQIQDCNRRQENKAGNNFVELDAIMNRNYPNQFL
jgi:hypothetical protein